MNQTEAKYAENLKRCQILGAVEWFAFEAIKFRLADRTFYTPDFIVMLGNGELEAH